MTSKDPEGDTARRPRRWWTRCTRLFRWVGLHDGATVATIAVAGLGIFVLVRLGRYAQSGETHGLDREILLAMRSADDVADPLGPGWVEEIGRDLTALGGIAVLALFSTAALGYALMRREKLTALMIALSVGGGNALSLLLKHYYDRARPDLVTHQSIVYTKSFPSGHSMMAAVTYLTLAALLVRVQPSWRLKLYVLVLAASLTMLVGISRVYLGVHWPSDVVAGWSAGAAWAALAWYVARKLQQRRHIEPAEEGVPPD